MPSRPDLRELAANVKEAFGEMDRETLLEILTFVVKEYVVEGPPPMLVHQAETLADLQGLTFAQLIQALQTRLDHPELTVAPAVEHRRPTGAGHREQEEVVAEQLHLERGFLRGHRFDGDLLRLDDRELIGLGFGGRVGHRTAVVPGGTGGVPAVDTTLVKASHLLLDLFERDVERGVVVPRGGVPLHQVLVDVDEDLALVRVGRAPRGVLGEVDVDPPDILCVLGDPVELLERVRA